MQPAPVDLDTEDLLQSHVAEVDGRAEMIEQRKLAALARRLEDDGVVPERIGERVGKARVQIAVFVEEADGLGALTGFDDELDRPGVEPLITLLDEDLDGVVVEIALVLLPQLELHVQSARTGARHDVVRLEVHLGESLAAFDPVEAEAGDEVEVLVEPPL